MMDIFEKPMPMINSKGVACDLITTGDVRDKFFNEVVPNSPNLLFLLLTKRPSNINKYIPYSWVDNPPANVMFGTSPVNQLTAEKLIAQLLQVNGKRFLSVEPQLGDISFRWAKWHDYKNKDNATPIMHEGKPHLSYGQYDGMRGIDWVIQGGESGHHKRPFNLEWARKMKEQCREANIPYFFKQIDKIKEIPEDLMIRQFPTS